MGFTAGYKVNAETQYEFTVSNETIQEAVQATGGITDADISEFCYTALIDNRIHRLIAASTADPINFSSAAAIRAWSHEHTPYYFGEPEAVISNTDLNGVSDTVYERNFLIWHGTIYPGTENEKTGTFLVMDMVDIKRWYIDYDTNMFYDTELESTSTREGGEFTGYNGTAYSYNSSAIAGNPEFRCDNNDPLLNPDTNMSVCNVLVINTELWIGQLNPSNKGKNEILYAYSIYANYISPTLRGYIDNTISEQPTYYQKGTINFAGIPYVANMNYPEISGETFTFQSYAETNNDYIIDVSGKYGGDWHVTTGGVLCKTLNALKKWMSWCGLKFRYNNTMYKPIIEGGIIVGYSDDMDADSEYDDMTNVTGNDIPSGPPKPPPEPDTDDPWHGVSYGSGGYGASPFCTSYAMTGAELTQLAAWGGKTEEQGGPKAGYDYMPSIISLAEMPMEVSGTVPSTVKFSRGTLGGYESNIVDTGVSGNPITAATQRYNLGSVTLPLRMAARGYPFLDWDTVVELYLPFVGMFSLDPFAVLGKTITAFMDLDVLNGTICGYAYVTNSGEKLPVAYGSAQVGVSLPVTSDGAATARLALTTANSQLGSSIASSLLQLGTLATAGGTSAIQGSNAWTAMQSSRGAGLAAQTGRSIFAGGASDAAVRGYATSGAIGSVANSFANWGLSLKQLQSSNNTQVNGSMGGGSFSGWSTPNAAYVKIIRPHAAPGAKASEYGKTHAYPYEANATLAGCKGLTFAVNPNVTGITKATDAERSQIAEILMGGVIA